MSNNYYTPTGSPSTSSALSSSTIRSEFNAIEAGLDKLPALTGNGSKIVAVNSGATALEAITTTGTGSGVRATSPTLVTPTLGEATATKINKITFTAPATGATLTIADGKTLTVSNTLTFTGTDGSSVGFGGGGTVAYTANKLSAFAATSSAELAGVISDETGSGALVFANSPTLVTPALGVATATSVNKVAITAPASSATLAIADGGTLETSGGHSLTLTTTGETNVTLPTSGTLATVTQAEAPFSDADAMVVGSSDPTKKLRFEVDGLTTATTRVLTVPDADGTIMAYEASRFKVGSFTRDTTLAAGTQAVTGVGFMPRTVIFLAAVDATFRASIGVDDGTTAICLSNLSSVTVGATDYVGNASIALIESAGDNTTGAISAFGNDGFTVTWAKSGAPTSIATICYLALR